MQQSEIRLRDLLEAERESPVIQAVTPDASTRDYFRISWRGRSSIACVYPSEFASAEHSFLDTTSLFLAAGLPVAEIYHVDEERGIIIQEDFGSIDLRTYLQNKSEAESTKHIKRAITLIPQIQRATALAFERNSVASRLSFDVEKLSSELVFFKEHYFHSLTKSPIPSHLEPDFDKELSDIVSDLAGRADELAHRDFHAANIMVAADDSLKIIDHQDARLGSQAYDLVSLLLDRVVQAPEPTRLAELIGFYLEKRAEAGLAMPTPAEFQEVFQIQTIQRCLKAVGTFSFQSAFRGKTQYLQFISPMLKIVIDTTSQLNRYPIVRTVIERSLQTST